MPELTHVMTPIPSFDTERLTLRGHTRDDFADCAAMWGSPEVTRHIGGRTFSEEEVWSKLLRYVGHWSLLGFGFWVITEKGSNRFVGEVGFADFKRDIDASFEGAPEIGWALAPWAHGKGFATESVRGAMAWYEAHFDGPRTVCMIDPANGPSLRVAAKCGYEEFRRATYKGQPTILFDRTRRPS
jgi:RimJ/RimL family protein N-acetyltransferase